MLAALRVCQLPSGLTPTKDALGLPPLHHRTGSIPIRRQMYESRVPAANTLPASCLSVNPPLIYLRMLTLRTVSTYTVENIVVLADFQALETRRFTVVTFTLAGGPTADQHR